IRVFGVVTVGQFDYDSNIRSIRGEGESMFRPQLPPAVADLIGAARDLDLSSVHQWAAEDRAAFLAGMQQLQDAAAAVSLEVLSSVDTFGVGQTLHCAATTTAWLKGALHLSGGEASQRVRLARQSRAELAHATARLRKGEVTFEQVGVIGKAVRNLPQCHRGEVAKILTDLAAVADVENLTIAARQVGQFAPPDGAAAQADKDYTRRQL